MRRMNLNLSLSLSGFEFWDVWLCGGREMGKVNEVVRRSKIGRVSKNVYGRDGLIEMSGMSVFVLGPAIA